MVCDGCAKEFQAEKRKMSAAKSQWALEKGALEDAVKKKDKLLKKAEEAQGGGCAAPRDVEAEAARAAAETARDAAETARDAAEAARDAALHEAAELQAKVEAAAAAGREALAAGSSALGDAQREAHQLREEVEELRRARVVADVRLRELDALEAEAEVLKAERAAMARDAADREADARLQAAEVEELRRQLVAREAQDREAARLRDELAASRAEAQALTRGALERDRADAEARLEELEQSRSEAAALRKEREEYAAEMVLLRKAVEELELGERDVSSEELDTAREEARALKQQLADAATELVALRTQAEEVEDLRRERLAAEARLQELELRCAGDSADKTEAQAQTGTGKATVDEPCPSTCPSTPAALALERAEAAVQAAAVETAEAAAQTAEETPALARCASSPTKLGAPLKSPADTPLPPRGKAAPPKAAPPAFPKGKAPPPKAAPPKAKAPGGGSVPASPRKAGDPRVLRVQWEKPKARGGSGFVDPLLEHVAARLGPAPAAAAAPDTGCAWAGSGGPAVQPHVLLSWFTKAEKAKEEAETPSKKKKASAVMDSTECVRVGVIMQRMGFSKNPKTMFEALIRCDESLLDTDDLDNLRRSFPSKATRDAVRRLPKEDLGDCDAFVRSLDSIPKLEERLQCMVFARRFELHCADSERRLGVLRSGLAFCAKSVELRTILVTLLRVGNVLNQDSRLGNFESFALSSAVHALAHCVSPQDKRVTLRVYAVSLMPETVSTFVDSALAALPPAKEAGSEQTTDQVRDLVDSFEKIRQREVERRRSTLCAGEVDSRDEFFERMEAFVRANGARVQGLAQSTLAFGREYVANLGAFGDAGSFWPAVKSEGDRLAPDLFDVLLHLAQELRKDLATASAVFGGKGAKTPTMRRGLTAADRPAEPASCPAPVRIAPVRIAPPRRGGGAPRKSWRQFALDDATPKENDPPVVPLRRRKTDVSSGEPLSPLALNTPRRKSDESSARRLRRRLSGEMARVAFAPLTRKPPSDEPMAAPAGRGEQLRRSSSGGAAEQPPVLPPAPPVVPPPDAGPPSQLLAAPAKGLQEIPAAEAEELLAEVSILADQDMGPRTPPRFPSPGAFRNLSPGVDPDSPEDESGLLGRRESICNALDHMRRLSLAAAETEARRRSSAASDASRHSTAVARPSASARPSRSSGRPS